MSRLSRKKPDNNSEPRRRSPILDGQNKRSYSYYSSRRSAGPAGSAVGRSKGSASETRSRSSVSSQPKRALHFNRSLSFWAIVALVAVIFFQLVYVGSNGRVLDAGGGVSQESLDDYSQTFKALLSKGVLNRTKLTLDVKGIEKELQKAHPDIESVTVSTPILGSRPEARVTVSPPAFVLYQQGQGFILSESGYVSLLPEDFGDIDLLSVQDETGEPVEVSKRLIPASHVDFMQSVSYQLKSQQMAIETFILPAGQAFELRVRIVGKPYYAKFNLAEDSVLQSGALAATVKQLDEQGKSPSEYVDVRVPGKVYYK